MKDPNLPSTEWTVAALLRWTAEHFKRLNLDSPRVTAEILLAHALGCRRIDLYLRFDEPVGQAVRQCFRVLVQRRGHREPVAYITAEREFWSLPIKVDSSVLIPRPDSECLVEAAVRLLPAGGEPKRVLDLGTGSGALVLALASERPDHRYTATDRSPAALKTASANAVRLGLAQRIRFLAGDWFAPFAPVARWDLVLSNPPYIPRPVIETLEPEVACFEPHLALDGGVDGLDSLRHLIRMAPLRLVPGGWLVLEMGADQRPAVEALISDSGAYDTVEFRRDYAGKERVACLRCGPTPAQK